VALLGPMCKWRRVGEFAITIGFGCMLILMTPAYGQLKWDKAASWEVDTPPGEDSLYALRAIQGPRANDLYSIEYRPELSVLCEKRSIGPYGHSRTGYHSLRVEIAWFASALPNEFNALAAFLRAGIDSHAADPRGNMIWVSYGRAWTASGGFADLIKIGDEDSTPIETVKITSIQTGFRLSAEILDSNQANAFLKAYSSRDEISAVIRAKSGDLKRAVDIRGMKLAVDKVLSFCGRDPL
jgi:hypothetical protein